MKYLWEVMVQAEEQGLMEEQLRFKMAERYSPYTELSFPFLNPVSYTHLTLPTIA